MINVGKLHQELVQAGIPIDGVVDATPPYIDFRPEATDEQRQQAQAILDAHVPEDYRDRRQQAYIERGVTVEAMVIALWERVVEGRPEASDALQSIRETIKAEFPADR